MPLPADVREMAVTQVERFCERRVPVDMRSQMRLEHTVRGNAITLVERRPPWSELVGPGWSTIKIAQLRYDGGIWTLFCPDRNGRWWPYDDADPTPDLATLLAAIDEDPTGIFWG
ncbi:MAG: DUF3024 domain-containing protein [Chloroflexota bacterium]|nr:DUF3024 domain-containing protein [Chloroflexota bacterium]